MLISMNSEGFEYKNKRYISYSELKTWMKCKFKHYQLYMNPDTPPHDGVSIRTVFGKAVHSSLDAIVKQIQILKLSGRIFDDQLLRDLNIDYFCNEFKFDFLAACRKHDLEIEPSTIKIYDSRGISYSKLKDVYIAQGQAAIRTAILALFEQFGRIGLWDVAASEYELKSMIDGVSPGLRKFIGYIDLVVRTKSDNDFHIIDWKTTERGWTDYDLKDRFNLYQLALYARFFAKASKIDPSKIKTYYGLMTLETGKTEIKEVAITNLIESALKELRTACYTVDRHKLERNTKSCRFCPYTDLCELF